VSPFSRKGKYDTIKKTSHIGELPVKFLKNKSLTRLSALFLSFLLILGGLSLASCSDTLADALDLAVGLMEAEANLPTEDAPIDEDGWYTDKDDVALYLWT
jgi:hypothetical protein